MKIISVILAFVSLLISQEEIILKPTNKNPFNFNEDFKILDSKDGFYNEVMARSAPSGNIYIYDMGNKLCHKYSTNGKYVSSFGKEGNGPGEFSTFITDFYASDNRLIFIDLVGQKVMLFNTDGKFITDIKGNQLILSQPVISNNKIEFFFPKNELTKVLKITYDINGKELSKLENKELKEGELDKLFSGKTTSADMKKQLEKPVSFLPFNGGFVQHYTGTYKIELLGLDFVKKKKYTFDFKRVKINDLMELLPRGQRDLISKLPDAQLKAVMQRLTVMKNSLNGYHPDIVDIIGTYKNYVLVQARSESLRELKLHIINDKDELVQIASIECDEITSARVTNGLLLINQVNDEIGPYTSVYSLQ